MCLEAKTDFHFHPVNSLFLITGGLHLLRGTSLHCCRFAHSHWDCYSRRALIQICENSLSGHILLFPPLFSLQQLSHRRRVRASDFTFRDLFYVTQQVPWLHMLYAAIGAIIYTLVSPNRHMSLRSLSAHYCKAAVE